MQITITEEQSKKYYPTLNEITIPLKSTLDIVSNLNLLLLCGLKRVNYGMQQWAEVDKFPSFDDEDPYVPYKTKNFYFLATNHIFFNNDVTCPWRILPPYLHEHYFKEMLKSIKDYEYKYKDNKKVEYRFNKGMVYANLGVAQASQMKIDESFANIGKALIEDFGYSSSETPEKDTFQRRLFTQFEKEYIEKHLQNVIQKFSIIDTTPVEQFVREFLQSLNDDQRIFFDFMFARIIQNWDIWNDKENGFTANRLLAYTQDFCLFNEDFLKSKTPQEILDEREEGGYWELRSLINANAFEVQIERSPINTMEALEERLVSDLGTPNQPEKCLRILLTLRNYSSHNVTGGSSANCFYARYNEILSELIRAMCYIQLL